MNNITNLIAATSNLTMLFILIGVIAAFALLLGVLVIVFVIGMHKRAPVVKVIMAPSIADIDDDEDEQEEGEATAVAKPELRKTAEEEVASEFREKVVSEPVPQPAPVQDEDENDDDAPSYVIEGDERVRYDRSLIAKICRLNDETKEWYSVLKNELLSYERVKARMSWRRESFRIGRMTFARLTVRGKTLCLMLAVEPDGYEGTKYNVEDVSNVNSSADTPTLYRIKSARKLKYAKEMISGVMQELKIARDPNYGQKDFFLQYEDDTALMQRGLVKRIVIGSSHN